MATGTLQDLLNSGMSREEINALLSQSNVSTAGFDLMGTTGRGEPYMPPEPGYGPAGMVDQAPMNTIRNNSTGRVIPMGQSQPAGPALDYSSPIEIGGQGKGYRLKGDSTRAVINGQMVSLGRDTVAERARMLEDLKIQAQRAQIDQTRAQTAATGSGGQDWMKDFDSSGKLLLVNRRTGEIKRPSEEVVGAKYSADLAGQIAGAKTKGEATGKRDVNMQGLGDTIQEADDLLKGATGKPLPTGSTFGTAADAVGGAFGFSPSGAAEAQRLKAIGGALTSKIPRMEGPQSDKDVQLYKEMAGVVGDSTVPRDRRIAALDEVKKLWSKYEKQPGVTPQAMAPQDAQALAWATANPSDPRAAQIKAKLGVK